MAQRRRLHPFADLGGEALRIAGPDRGEEVGDMLFEMVPLAEKCLHRHAGRVENDHLRAVGLPDDAPFGAVDLDPHPQPVNVGDIFEIADLGDKGHVGEERQAGLRVGRLGGVGVA